MNTRGLHRKLQMLNSRIIYIYLYVYHSLYFSTNKAKKLDIAVGQSVDVNKIENELLAEVSGEKKRFIIAFQFLLIVLNLHIYVLLQLTCMFGTTSYPGYFHVTAMQASYIM